MFDFTTSLAVKAVFLLAVFLTIVIVVLWTTGNIGIISDIATIMAKTFTRSN